MRPGNLTAAQALEDMRDEVERSSALPVGQTLQQGSAVGGEPGQLIVEMLGLSSSKIVRGTVFSSVDGHRPVEMNAP